MRTVKRKVLFPNTEKHKSLNALCQAYAREKRYWIQFFQSWSNQAQLGAPRTVRDQMIQQKYHSSYGLQARHWKLALNDAAETWDKYWQAIFVKVRSKIARHKDFTETERHYAYWLLKGYPQFAKTMQGSSVDPPFPIASSLKKRVTTYVRRIVRQLKGKAPSVKKARSVRFDANCYEVFEHNGCQYIKLMSLQPGKRIILPLSGKTQISGTITLVISDEGIHIHVPQKLKKRSIPKNPIEAVDFGYTEVMTDTEGLRYGKQFGTILNRTSDSLSQKMQKRHKLHALEKKQRDANPQRASHVRKYNLGKEKHFATMRKSKATLEKEINTGINQLVRTKHPSLIITEDLRHPFVYDKSKKLNRKLSSWLRGKLQDRISFKALAEGFRHEQVNPAFGSQSCPSCEFVDHRNRIGDNFMCLYCGHEAKADRVAALNYARRYGDHEIGQYTPYRQVKTILLGRFHPSGSPTLPVASNGSEGETPCSSCLPSGADWKRSNP